jgi:hypothetical protein
MNALDENARLMNGTLPHDPEEEAEPMSAPVPKRPGPRNIVCIGAIEMAKPLPPVTFLIDALGIAPGAPVCVAGYGFAGKTLALQSLALSLAADRPVWGVHAAKRARVLHIDYEQGSRLTCERYQRLARGIGVNLASLEGRLSLSVMPEVYLDDADAADAYARAMHGYDLVILDSLRAAAPTSDENSSEIRRHIDQFGRAAEKTGSVPLFIHHARKPKADDPEGAKYKIRGSSALFDACASVFVLEGAKDAPTRVTHEKCRNRGVLVADFGLRIEDVHVDGDPRGALRVVHMEGEQLDARPTLDPRANRSVDRVRAYLREHGVHKGNKDALRAAVGLGQRQCYAAVSVLESEGEIAIERGAGGTFIRWVGAAK